MEDIVDTLCEHLLLIDLEKEEIHVELSSICEVVSRERNCLLVKLLSR